MNNESLDPAGLVRQLGRKFTSDSEKQLAFSQSGGSVQYTSGKFNLVQSRDIGSNLVALLKEEYQKVAAALNIPYYELTGDTSGMDFSSIRAVLITYRNRLEFIYNVITIPDILLPLTRRFKEIALALGYPVSNAIPTFQFPRWHGVDDLKDYQADLLAVISGFKPITAVWAELGYTKEQIEQSKIMLTDMGFAALFEQKQTDPTLNNSKPKSNTTGS